MVFLNYANPNHYSCPHLSCNDLLYQILIKYALDAEELSLSIITSKLKDDQKDRLIPYVTTFENMKLAKKADIVNASLSLPFCHPETFSICWRKTNTAVKVGGRFSGHFFGVRDGWSNDPTMTFLTKKQVRKLFKHYEIESFNEVESDKPTAQGVVKHWHIFHVVAKKIK